MATPKRLTADARLDELDAGLRDCPEAGFTCPPVAFDYAVLLAIVGGETIRM